MEFKVGSIIAKVSNMCNLDCSYCYVFNRGDDHYVGIPNKMSKEHCEQLLLKIKDHCLAHNIPCFVFAFHGGEPLLMGIPFYEWILETSEKIFKDTSIRMLFLMQTNGTLMTEKWAQFLTSHHIDVGFSIDGYESIHNENRVYKNSGKGSFQDVIKGINVFKKYKEINVLSVVNTKADPNLFYQTCKEIGIGGISLLFQDANYKDHFDVDIEGTADWMIQLFDIWYDDPHKSPLRMMNPFSLLINLLLGDDEVGNDAFGEVMNSALLVLTNGEIQVTGLEKCQNESPQLFNIATNSLDDVFQEKIFRDYYFLHDDEMLCESCINCLIKPICGGGRLSHRFSEENGFDNPTIYCNTMKRLVVHIQNKLFEKLPDHIKEKTHIEKLSLSEL